jgi:signal transduction histidine kinase
MGWVIGALAGAVGVAAALAGHGGWVDAGLGLVVGWSFAGAGITAWVRRPANRTGYFLIAVGFAWFLDRLATTPIAWLATPCQLFRGLYLALLAHLLLAFPTGRLTSPAARGITVGAYLDTAGLQVVLLLIAPGPRLAQMLDDAQTMIGIVLALALIGVLISRWRPASAAARRTLTPIVASGGATVVMLVVILLDERFSTLQLYPVSWWLYLAALICVPLGFLTGLLRTRLAHAGVAELMVTLGEGVAPGALRDALARGLGDPSLQLAYWIPERQGYVDLRGHPVTLPQDGAHAATVIERDGRRIGALVHDPALDDDPDLLGAVRAAAALALENERLQADLRARLGELDRSRSRLVEAADAERRRIERNLHDAVQQRLVSASLTLGMAAAKLAAEPAAGTAPATAAATKLLHEARGALAAGLAELREIAHGIHPAMLTERGLKAALTELAWTAPLPVTLSADLDGRLPEPVEATAYYVAAEALTNVSKHAGASQVWISARHDRDGLIVEVRDDGTGGADPAGGTGLAGLADRAAAAGGRLEVHSPAGAGTRIRAQLPCEPCG